MASASLTLIVGEYAGHEPSFFNGLLGARPSRMAIALYRDKVDIVEV
ncbi:MULTISPECIES: hypothetical protein [unclassified Psychrobacter]|nr:MULTISPECIES: hypothetical protein [unclassified Psychrobacter]MCG3857683.1 hypothetical protein [Psychrobacter sp. Ps2]NYR09899.1 hypothetical protein [Psychrobacter sp. BI730]